MRTWGVWSAGNMLLVIWVLVAHVGSDCESSLAICTFLYICYASI